MTVIRKTLPNLDQGTPEWLEQRRGMVTASVVGQLLTGTLKVANNDTSRGLTARLVAERITGYVEPTFVNDDMLRGQMDEPIARDLYAEHIAKPTGEKVEEVGFMTADFGGYVLGFSPDGLVGKDGLIEVKSRRQKKHLQTVLSDVAPDENMAQIQAGLLVSGRDWCDYISYCGGMAMWVKRVTPSAEWQAAIVAAVQTFEANAVQMAADYATATAGLPMTERLDLDMVI